MVSLHDTLICVYCLLAIVSLKDTEKKHLENQPNDQTIKSLSLAGLSFGRKESPKEFESLLGYHLPIL
jgi:hypothetical protein